MEAKSQTECQKEKEKSENIRKVSGAGKNIIAGVTRKNVSIPSTSVTKPCVPSERVTKLGSQGKNGTKLNGENTAKTAICKNSHKTGVSRKHSNKEKTTNKNQVKPITTNDGDTKSDPGKDLPDESNTDSVNIKPCATDAKNDVTGDKVTQPTENETPETEQKLDDTQKTTKINKNHVKPITTNDGDMKSEPEKDLSDASNTDSVNIKPCVTDAKNVTEDKMTRPTENETPETEKKLDDTQKTTKTNKNYVKPITTNDGDMKSEPEKDLSDASNADSVNIKPCVTNAKNDVTGDKVTRPTENETPETEKKLDDTQKTEMVSDELTVNETQTDRTEQKQSEITEDVSDNQADKDMAKEKTPKSMTAVDMIDEAISCFENEDYMKCIIICEEVLNTDWKDLNDHEQFSKAFLYIGKSYENLDELEKALKHYQFSVAVSKNPTLSRHMEEIIFKLDEQKKKSAEEENKKGNDCFKLKQFKEALTHYTEAIKRNPEQAKFYSNRSACYLKLKEYLLSLSDAQNCIGFDPKSVKGYFREGAAYLALNKPSKACASYSAILQIDPDNEEAKKRYSKSTEKARLDPNDPEAVKKRIEEEPELVQILNDRHVRLFLAEMEKDPTAVKNYIQDISTRKKIQKLLECGLLNASGPNPLLRN